MAQIKVTKLDRQGEQTTYIFENDKPAVYNLASCFAQYAMKMAPVVNARWSKTIDDLQKRVQCLAHFYALADEQTGDIYLTRFGCNVKG